MAHDPIALLIEHGEEHGCVHMTELYEITARLELEEEDIENLLERLEQAGIELTDDCSRAIEEDVAYTNQQIASATTDSLQLFLNEAGRYALLTAAQEAEQAKLPIKQVREVRAAARAVASLDRPVGEDDSAAFGDLFASAEATPDEQVEVDLTEQAL